MDATQITESRLTLTVPEAAKVVGVSRALMYQMIRSKDFPTVKVGKRLLVSVKGLERWVDQQAAKGWG